MSRFASVPVPVPVSLAFALLLALPLAAACQPATAPVAARCSAAVDVTPVDVTLVDVTPVDLADRECRVVLRQADHVTGSRDQGESVLIDVSSALLADPGATPGLLVRADGGDWQTLGADANDGAPAGYQRFVARFGLANHADFVAFATTTSAVRLFDHNRLPGDFDDFHVDAANGWTVAPAPALCPGTPPTAHLGFFADYSDQLSGPLVAGGRLVVDYDLDRLTTCRATHDGFRAWTLDAFARFLPDGELRSGTVVASNGFNIAPTPFVTDVPAGATSVALWFRNASQPDCQAWDSDYGRNYTFSIGN